MEPLEDSTSVESYGHAHEKFLSNSLIEYTEPVELAMEKKV